MSANCGCDGKRSMDSIKYCLVNTGQTVSGTVDKDYGEDEMQLVKDRQTYLV